MQITFTLTQDHFLTKHLHNFETDISDVNLPDEFTYPFYYEPHLLVKIAAQELQKYLAEQTEFKHNFGLHNKHEQNSLGKMFGVLVVKDHENNLAYLTAYSGKLQDNSKPDYFVPPICDIHAPNSFFKKGEAELDALTHQISTVQNNEAFLQLSKDLTQHLANFEKEKLIIKSELKSSKQDRKLRREAAKANLSEGDFEKFNKQLTKESLDGQYTAKRYLKSKQEEIDILDSKIKLYSDQIKSLSFKRKEKSAKLQLEIFSQYHFLNIRGESKALIEIFPKYREQQPPGGTGECCAPRLLQYAFKNNLSPLAIGEFWWGVSPKTEIRHHGQFYPACRSRCKPILAHMLKGLDIEENPLLKIKNLDTLEVLFEDEHILVINKPPNYLTVPGKENLPSIYSRVKAIYSNIEEPIIVHRLDMATSGILVLAKTKSAHKVLQAQFLDRSVKKRYVAILDGDISGSEGMIELPLRVDLDDRPRQVVCYEYGKIAKTKWKVIKRDNNQTLIQLYPITGRTHQLRVHMAHKEGLNTAILGDDLYGKKADRLYLHADYIQVKHPVNGKKMNFSAPSGF